MRGNIICLLALYGCIPMVLYVFSKYEPEKAVIIAFFGALLFLPMEELNIPLILYDKMTATAIGVLIAIKVYGSEKLESTSLHPVDIPMIIWIFSGLFSSISNGLGVKDGLQESFNTFTLWGIPYMAGRIYFTNGAHMKLLCTSIFASGLIYIPFVLFELKMSPQSHRIVYGYMQHSFAQVIRGGGYRPMVFMEHGIMLGTWMCMAALVGAWCAYTKAFPKKMWHAPTTLLVFVLFATAVACKSSGAIGLMILGLSVLILTWKMKFGILVWILFLIPPAYIGTRATGYWDGQNLCDLITEKFSADRAASLQFRFDNENILVEKALKRPLLGWGGWGRARVYSEETGEDISITDGFWIITLGTRGYLGLFTVTLAMILPSLLFILKCPARKWGRPEFAPTAVLCIIPLLFMIDCLLNAMVNQIYIIFAGATSGMLATYGINALRDQEPFGAKTEIPDSMDFPRNIRPTWGLGTFRLNRLRNVGSKGEWRPRPLVEARVPDYMHVHSPDFTKTGFHESVKTERSPETGETLITTNHFAQRKRLEKRSGGDPYSGPRNLMESRKIDLKGPGHPLKTKNDSGISKPIEKIRAIGEHFRSNDKWARRS